MSSFCCSAHFGAREAGQAPDGTSSSRCRPTNRCSRLRTPSTCSTRAARFRSPSALPTSAASATWRAAVAQEPMSTVARTPRLSRWRPRRADEVGGTDPKQHAKSNKTKSRLTMSSKNLLIELFVEELPPKSLKKAGRSVCRLARAVAEKCAGWPRRRFDRDRDFATPRRLAVHMTADSSRRGRPTRTWRRKLMPATVGLDASGQTPRRPCSRNSPRLGADASDVSQPRAREATARPKCCCFDSMVPRANRLPSRVQKALDEAIDGRSCPSPRS